MLTSPIPEPMQVARVPERLKNCMVEALALDMAVDENRVKVEEMAGNGFLALIDLMKDRLERDPRMTLQAFLDEVLRWGNLWQDPAKYARIAAVTPIEEPIAVPIGDLEP